MTVTAALDQIHAVAVVPETDGEAQMFTPICFCSFVGLSYTTHAAAERAGCDVETAVREGQARAARRAEAAGTMPRACELGEPVR